MKLEITTYSETPMNHSNIRLRIDNKMWCDIVIYDGSAEVYNHSDIIKLT